MHRKAAEGGNGYAQRRLGIAYEKGKLDLAIGLEAARAWYHMVAKGGDSYAQRRLGWAYEYDEFDLVIDLVAALTCFQNVRPRRRPLRP